MKTAIIFLVLFVVGASQASTIGSTDTIEGIAFNLNLIFNGISVPGREIPGIVALKKQSNRGEIHYCGGSIINENYIVSAAHCILDNSEYMKILSGTNSLVQGGIRHNVLETHIHEDYNESDSWINDIAVVKVDPPFVFDDGTAAVTLPQQGQDTPAGSTATVAGWGYTEEGILPRHLRKVSIQIWNHDECKRIYNELKLNVHRKQICAGNENGNRGSCGFDSGGPLFVDGQVIGIVSWARGCSLKSWPTVYTRVSAYIDWINSKVSS